MSTSGEAAGRDEVVERALERERRRKIAERDIAFLRAASEDDLDELAKWCVQRGALCQRPDPRDEPGNTPD